MLRRRRQILYARPYGCYSNHRATSVLPGQINNTATSSLPSQVNLGKATLELVRCAAAAPRSLRDWPGRGCGLDLAPRFTGKHLCPSPAGRAFHRDNHAASVFQCDAAGYRARDNLRASRSELCSACSFSGRLTQLMREMAHSAISRCQLPIFRRKYASKCRACPCAGPAITSRTDTAPSATRPVAPENPIRASMPGNAFALWAVKQR